MDKYNAQKHKKRSEAVPITDDPRFALAVEKYNRTMLPRSFSEVRWGEKILLETLMLPFLQNFLMTTAKALIATWKRQGGLVGLVRSMIPRASSSPNPSHHKF